MRRSSRAANGAASSRSYTGAELAEAADPRRQLLLALLQAGLQRVDGRRCVREALSRTDGPVSHVWVAAVGKAAVSMALGAHDAWGSAIERTLIITHDPDAASAFPAGRALELLASAHPLPDERSLAAGERLLAWVDTLPDTAQPLFLISGGSSALVEVPESGASLQDLEALTRLSFAHGMPITELNARRAALSR